MWASTFQHWFTTSFHPITVKSSRSSLSNGKGYKIGFQHHFNIISKGTLIDEDSVPLRYVLWCCGSICHKLFTFIQIGSDRTLLEHDNWAAVNQMVSRIPNHEFRILINFHHVRTRLVWILLLFFPQNYLIGQKYLESFNLVLVIREIIWLEATEDGMSMTTFYHSVLCKSSIVIYLFNTTKCAANYVILFEVYDGFIGQKILKLWRQESWPFGPGSH